MYELDITADELISALMNLAVSEHVSILDSCGVGYLGSHLLIAGIHPIETAEITNNNSEETLTAFDKKLSGEAAAIFTISYDFGLKLLGIGSPKNSPEPDIFYALFDVLVIHDYETGKTQLTGNSEKFEAIYRQLKTNTSNFKSEIPNERSTIASNFTKPQYLAAVETIKENIRRGDTYQTNLTQQLTAKLQRNMTPEKIFHRLRQEHPAPFAAFIKRPTSTVISASPERFFRIGSEENLYGITKRTIETSPIKGTRPRGITATDDEKLKKELMSSKKDRAENTMIVDLLRNDLGRICEYGSVQVKKLCEMEEHPTFFHLVSTVGGDLREGTKISEILKAVFPCGSITGAPKINTIRIINEIENAARGLSMGAIGYYMPRNFSEPPSLRSALDSRFDLSVAIRTMVVRDSNAIFNVGGGITIDSDPESEYNETLTKAKALLSALGANFESQS